MVTSVLTGQCVGKNTATTNILRWATLVINTNLDMMWYSDLFLRFIDKYSCIEINIDEFWEKCQYIYLPGQAHKHCPRYLIFSISAFLLSSKTNLILQVSVSCL